MLRTAFYFIPSAMTGSIASVFSFRNRVSAKEAFEGLELGAGKLSRPVLRGPRSRKAAWLLGSYQRTTRSSPDLSRNRTLKVAPNSFFRYARSIPAIAMPLQTSQPAPLAELANRYRVHFPARIMHEMRDSYCTVSIKRLV